MIHSPTPSTGLPRQLPAGIVNGGSIYGTRASPFARLPWGRCTRKTATGGGTLLYLHVFDRPAGDALIVPGLTNPVRKAWLLADEQRSALSVERRGGDTVVCLPVTEPSPVTVIVLEIDGTR